MQDIRKLNLLISLVLRHRPELIGISLDPYGWADVNELIDGINKTGKWQLDRLLLDQIVEQDEQHRYSYHADGMKIRANRGHTVAVQKELIQCQPPETLYCGTDAADFEVILEQGLAGPEEYVSLFETMESAVKGAKSHGMPLVLPIDSGQMHQDGYSFYRSSENQWLCRKVPAKYILLG